MSMEDSCPAYLVMDEINIHSDINIKGGGVGGVHWDAACPFCHFSVKLHGPSAPLPNPSHRNKKKKHVEEKIEGGRKSAVPSRAPFFFYGPVISCYSLLTLKHLTAHTYLSRAITFRPMLPKASSGVLIPLEYFCIDRCDCRVIVCRKTSETSGSSGPCRLFACLVLMDVYVPQDARRRVAPNSLEVFLL